MRCIDGEEGHADSGLSSSRRETHTHRSAVILPWTRVTLWCSIAIAVLCFPRLAGGSSSFCILMQLVHLLLIPCIFCGDVIVHFVVLGDQLLNFIGELFEGLRRFGWTFLDPVSAARISFLPQHSTLVGKRLDICNMFCGLDVDGWAEDCDKGGAEVKRDSHCIWVLFLWEVYYL